MNPPGIKDTHRNPVGIFLTDALGLSLSLLEGVLVLELGSHRD
jgi:hypothetical protein